MTTETLAVTVLRVVKAVAPRRLTALDVIASCPDANSGSVYATLSNLSKDNKGPLNKARSLGGLLDYGIAAGVDVDAWIAARKSPPISRERPARSGSPEDAAQIITLIRRSTKRPTSNEIYEVGNFADRSAMLLELQAMCEDDGPLERTRPGMAGTFTYGIKTGFAVDSYLKGRGSAIEEPDTLHQKLATSPTPARPAARFVQGAATVDDDARKEPAPMKELAPTQRPTAPTLALAERTTRVEVVPAPVRTEPEGALPEIIEGKLHEFMEVFQEDLLEYAEASADEKLKALASRVRSCRQLLSAFVGVEA